MSSGREELERLGQAGELGDVLDGFRERYGRHASREAAREFGVSQRTIQRAMRGDTRAPKFADTDQYRNATAAARIRSADSVSGGRVSVEYDGRDEGERTLPDFDMTGDFRTALEHVADLVEQGEYELAEEELSKAMLNEYEDGLGENLDITDFIDGLRFE
jgi:hypothetical protein